MSKNLKMNEPVNKKLISKNSEKIIQKRQTQNESKEETLKRLMIEKQFFLKLNLKLMRIMKKK